jgi:hypothetical protein
VGSYQLAVCNTLFILKRQSETIALAFFFRTVKSKNMTNHELILSIIEQLITKGLDENFAIFNLSKDYYIQISAVKDDTEVYCEAISNNYLPKENQLTMPQINQLKSLNWEEPASPQDNYSNNFPINSASEKTELANYLIKTAATVYNCEIITEKMVDLNLD